MGTPFVWEIDLKDAPPVAFNRDFMDVDGSYGIDSYEDYRQYDKGTEKGKGHAKDYVLLSDIKEIEYRVAFLNITNFTNKIQLKLDPLPLNSSGIDGICKYNVELPSCLNGNTSFYITTKSFENSNGDKEDFKYGTLNLTLNGNIIDNSSIIVKDGIGNIKGKIILANKLQPKTKSKTVHLVSVEIDGKKPNNAEMNVSNVAKILNEKSFNQTDIKWDVDPKIITWSINTQSTTNLILYNKVYQRDYIITLLQAEAISRNVENTYSIILNKFIKENATKLSLNSNDYYLFFLTNKKAEKQQREAWAISDTKYCMFYSNAGAHSLPHELGHNLGLGDAAADLGTCTQEQVDKGECPAQYNIHNIMGYFGNGWDFWKWQCDIINSK